MKKAKKLVWVLVVVMIFSFVSCGGEQESSTATSTSTSNTSDIATVTASDTADDGSEESVRSYDMFIRSQYHEWIKELKWYDIAEERTGIHVNYIDGPQEIQDTYNEVDQRLASRTLPEAAMVRLTQAKVYEEICSTHSGIY